MFPAIPDQVEYRDQRYETRPRRQPLVARPPRERCADRFLPNRADQRYSPLGKVSFGSTASSWRPAAHFRSTPINGHRQRQSACLKRARSGTQCGAFRFTGMPINVFVFGTLKTGGPLHKSGLEGAFLVGEYRTRRAFPLVIAGPWFAPMMFNEPGCGHNVIGEVYRIDLCRLQKLDELESLGKPGNFRISIEVTPLIAGPPLQAFAYMKSRDIAEGIYHSGFLDTYCDDRFVVPWQR
jgi:gamma-glutamylaminecyclotransferase